MNKIFRSALVVSFIVGAYAIGFHSYHNIPNDWGAFLLWIPLYISPIWALAGASYLSERGEE